MNVDEIVLKDDLYASEMESKVVPYTKEFEFDGYFNSFDGSVLHYRKYIKPGVTRGIVICHGFTENCEKYRELIYYFLQLNFNVYMWDFRDHGYSQRVCEHPNLVCIDSFDKYVMDMESFIEGIACKGGEEKLYLWAHSMGGGVAVSYLAKHADVFDKAVLCAPMIKPRTFVPTFVMKMFIGIMCSLGKENTYLPFVYRGYPTKERFDLVSNGSKIKYSYYYRICLADEHYRKFGGSVSWMRECLTASGKIAKKETVDKIQLPLLVFKVERDTRVRNRSIEWFCKSSQNARLQTIPGRLRHEIHTGDANTLKMFLEQIDEFFK